MLATEGRLDGTAGTARGRRAGRGLLAIPAMPTVLAVAAALALSFAGIASHSLWTPDEPRDAAIGKAMWRSGDFVVPRLNGQPFLEKPPLAWWAQVAVYELLGASDATARVPSALFAALTLLVTWALGRRLGGEHAGWLAAGALAGTFEYAETMHRAIVDPPMVLAVALAWFGFVLLLEEGGGAEGALGVATEGRGMERRRSPYLPREGHWMVALAATFAFLAKGVGAIGLALGPPVLVLVAAAAWPADRRARLAGVVRLLVSLALVGVPVLAALALPWAVALLREGGWPMLRECLVGNTIGRFFATAAGEAYGHREPSWYYLPAGAVSLLPWTLALPAVARRQLAAPGERAGRLLFGCFVAGTVILSLAASKRSLYLVPLMPGLAVSIGLWLDGLDGGWQERLGRQGRWRRWGSWDRVTALALLGLAALLPLVLWAAAMAAAHGAVRGIPVAPLRASLTAGRLATAGVAAAVAAALLLARLVRHLRAGSMPSGAWLVVPFVGIMLVYQTAVKAAIEPLKGPHELTAAVARLDPGGGPVAAYRPSETTRGIESFDLDRAVEPLDTPAELEALLARRRQARVVLSVADLRALPAEARRRLCILYDESATKASPFVIAGPCGSAGDPAWPPAPPG